MGPGLEKSREGDKHCNRPPRVFVRVFTCIWMLADLLLCCFPGPAECLLTCCSAVFQAQTGRCLRAGLLFSRPKMRMLMCWFAVFQAQNLVAYPIL